MAVKILHAADFHMDSAFDALPEEKAVQRRREQRELWAKIVRLVREESVQLVFLAGDLFDSAVAYYETQEVLLSALRDLKVPVVIAPGNHDAYSAQSPYAYLEFPENVRIFSSPTIRYFDFPELNTRVYGAGFTGQSCPDLLSDFKVMAGNWTSAMVVHGNVGGTGYNPILPEEIEASGLDYLALGHQHTFSGIRWAGRTAYAYPGCPEGRGFDETGAKGVLVGTIGQGTCDMRFVLLGGREYRELRVDLSAAASAEAAVDEAAGTGAPSDVCRIVLTGEYDGKIDPEALASMLASRYFHVVVRNETRPRRDIWEGMEEETLRGLFLRNMRERYDRADAAEAEAIRLAVHYGLAAIDNREEWRP